MKVWVSYFEENPKFGMGYLLNSNATGFRYNDATIMIINSKMNSLKYLDIADIKRRNTKEVQGRVLKFGEAEKTE